MNAQNQRIRRKLRIEPQFCQTDLMGHIHNSEFFRWFDEGRLRILWEIMTLDEAQRLNVIAPVIFASCTYQRYAQYGEPLVLVTTHKKALPFQGKFVFEHSLVEEKTKIEVASGESVLTLMERNSNQFLTRWPDEIWQRYLNLR